MTSLANELQTIRGRPMLKDALGFFEYKQGNRIFLTITDTTSVWQEDLGLAERVFADMIVLPIGSSQESELTETQAILKERMKYPGVKENPVWEQIAKTWVLPGKLSLGPSDSCFTSLAEDSLKRALEPVFTRLTPGEEKLHIVKVEIANGGERGVLYKILDECFRPSLLLVKWSQDLDEHIPTAHCAGHILASGYAQIAFENGYSLYMFCNDPLYDICSFKDVNLSNPILNAILKSIPTPERSEQPPQTNEIVPQQ